MNIRRIPTSQATPGMIAADDIYAFNDLLVIAKDTGLTDRIITRLKFYSIDELSIFIHEDSDEAEISFEDEPTPEPFIDEMLYSKKIRESEEFKSFSKDFSESVSTLSDSFHNISFNKTQINCDDLLADCNKILSNSRNNLHLFDMLHCIREYDDETYTHSINVALICHTIGNWINLSKEENDILTLCGLLHDIGKVEIPENIIKKPEKLTVEEYDLIKKHTLKGYQILKDQDIDIRIKHAALLHHERCDGTGYPNGFTNRSINDFTKIVSIADVYDAMTSKRVYRGPLCPFEVIGIFENEEFSKYDPKYILPFLTGIVQTYLHNDVILSNNRQGKIILINNHNLTKPVVQIGTEFVDLSKEPDLFIKEII
ncbi:HD-GYP domain-containing protein [Anaeromicropila herbilytica]|uniref:HD family phosphohydrolase n=1 Tax=Anaeromicropila herbilytica TaxID=2785025 RepID=A0A7R7IAR9_9FIRM|nr:HD domain-containing phosphohydrolase [Anaeromicropila herbilytica]BCN28758.1 HD family phosphohydrolase [Anaeromicropila herbilytica]